MILQMLQTRARLTARLLFMLGSMARIQRMRMLFLGVNLMLPGLATMVIFILVKITVFTTVLTNLSMANAAQPTLLLLLPIHILSKQLLILLEPTS